MKAAQCSFWCIPVKLFFVWICWHVTWSLQCGNHHYYSDHGAVHKCICSLGELVCGWTAFVQGPCLFGDLVRLGTGTSFIWGLNLSGNLISPRALVFQWRHFSEGIGSFANLIHPGTSFVPSLCLPGAQCSGLSLRCHRATVYREFKIRRTSAKSYIFRLE